MKNRYIFFKRLFKDYIIVFKIKDKYTSIGIDKLLIPYLRKNNINYVIIDEDNNVENHTFSVNEYDYYVKKNLLYRKLASIFLQKNACFFI